MGFQNIKSSDGYFEAAYDQAATGLADSLLGGLSEAAAEMLADPLTQALMAADRVDRNTLEELLRRISAKLPDRDPFGLRHC